MTMTITDEALEQIRQIMGKAEPVAWRWHYKLESDRWFYQPFKPDLSQLSTKWEVEFEPLYAAPPPAQGVREALERIMQRANESGTGEMALVDTIHAMHKIASDALALQPKSQS